MSWDSALSPRLTLASPWALIDDLQPGLRCQLSEAPLLHSSLLDGGDPQCLAQQGQESHRARVGGVLQDESQAPVCGLWKGLSTLRFGGRKCGFPIFPRQREEHRSGHCSLGSYMRVLMISQPVGQLEQTHFFVGLSFPICDVSCLGWMGRGGILQSVH